ncbi:hypothetical protein [Wenxinia saemankumensis]|uniref:hypothetical protein n=1 Tax=Wenxinia saemankumensis TaxID=1447782 RepID=UPI0011152608|nr:hypothetical protein [Wenxinia saemankumensis]
MTVYVKEPCDHPMGRITPGGTDSDGSPSTGSGRASHAVTSDRTKPTLPGGSGCPVGSLPVSSLTFPLISPTFKIYLCGENVVVAAELNWRPLEEPCHANVLLEIANR